ncbi:precorrin-2 C20-methyltransferase / precorrin-3B C17-methyltransferase [Lentzea albidocapillata subsp. violacea]|uniref:Precorrin-2 C20-methyltransferase / precorrin-3B C17-methyltransferase n=1 Tax=Lentzea albidocapillata subsp. violacea TaxID=128104 RepID=A0A1G9EYN6_9PSEU|nr:precorrin-2 C(20)-methyltransferase [Lentzea albidocapillata]SDK81279.1 precorrin-2 C20-methyltransferase / precorrin-3B C17-methyltransferase [Lentzea albidocapillata subsp. violacea]
MTGKLYGVGLGPGDPELVTVKAARLISEAGVVAFHSARHGKSVARTIAAPYLRSQNDPNPQIMEQLVYPVTTEDTDDYQGEIDAFYEEAAGRLAAHLDAGRDVVVLAAGDPFFYGSYMHMHKRLADRYEWEVVPGVTSVSGASAVLGTPLVERDEVLTILPGTLPPAELAARLADTDSAAILKLGRTFGNVREALEAAGRLDGAWYVERATTGRQKMSPLADVDPDSVPYFSLALLPSQSRPAKPKGEVVVVGLGPGARAWLTPEARQELEAADELVGYSTYLNRVPERPGQKRHSSHNQVESERAAFALDLARKGARVAVVSSGDPGVFAMATAVLEVAAESPDVPVRVIPGVTAANAVAAKAGAPLGHDYAVISLSDRLKPWDVIAERLEATAKADLVIAIYNPASKARTHQVADMRDLLLKHRAPDTPIVVGRDVGGPEEETRVLTLGALDPATIDMRCLLIIGSSQTIVTPQGVVFTPRRYPTS